MQILSSSNYGVSGCGHRVIYKYVPYVGIVSDTVGENKPSGPDPESKPAEEADDTEVVE